MGNSFQLGLTLDLCWSVTGISLTVGGYPKKILVWGSNKENSSVINEKAIKCYKMQ